MNTDTQTRLMDAFQRRVNYLRISITDRCNLRCRYCAPSRPERVEKDRLLTLEEIYRLVEIGVSLGISKVRLTGGEPLCRKGVVGLVRKLARTEGLQDISLTTNGTRITEVGKALLEAGLKRINISLDTLDSEKFRCMAGVDGFGAVWDGIMAASKWGFKPVKINTVVMKGFNDGEIEAIAELAIRYPFQVRFIEYMPIGTDPLTAHRHFLPIAEIEQRLRRMGDLTPVTGTALDGPARRYRMAGARGEIGLIGSMSSHFCRSCNRIRLTAGGQLRPCLLADDQVDLIGPMRQGATDGELAALFLHALAQKGAEHRMGFTEGHAVNTKMVSIGG